MQKSNHLIKETSPYLLQHAHNPVEWYPWNEETLNLARKTNKPILLSIGYAACHWCHVMAHESFEDPETAKVMNDLFINIKVDREERPDLDKIYQTAHYLLTQKPGGWPLTVFLSPKDLTPFFSGTYFPREPRYHLPAFKEVLRTIADIYQHSASEVEKQNQELRKVIQTQVKALENNQLDKKPLELAEINLSQIYDPVHGGFGGAPKFPRPTLLEFLLRNKSDMAIQTLRRMAEGGIYDHIEGGFFRYSVDERWEIPHFEKMLYDNGQLLFLYALAAKQTRDPLFLRITRQTADWVMKKMQAPGGGYYSSLDADSEGHEGKFYVWNKFEIDALLNAEELQFADLYFGLHQLPNFEKHWHLHVVTSLTETAKQLSMSEKKANEVLEEILQKLNAAREKRVPPACDNKILTSWNALMIKGMLAAGDVLDEPRFTASAHRALDFIQQEFWKNNHLMATTRYAAYLDDYAFLLSAIMTSLKLSWSTSLLEFARKLADRLLSDFDDKMTGGFFFTAEQHEKLLYRPKTFVDEAVPSGNGVAARALLLLGQLISEDKYVAAMEKTLKTAWPFLLQFPSEHCELLLALQEYFQPPQCKDGVCIRRF